MEPDFSGVALLGILNYRDKNDGIERPIPDSGTLDYLSGALVFIELARAGIIRLNPSTGITDARYDGERSVSELEDSFLTITPSAESTRMVQEFRGGLPLVSSLREHGAAVGRHALELNSEAIEAATLVASGRYSLADQYGAIASGNGDPFGDLYVARSLAALLSGSETGRSVSARLGHIKSTKVVHVPLQRSVWSEHGTDAEFLPVLATISGVVNKELTSRIS